jgi:hypothetical protein
MENIINMDSRRIPEDQYYLLVDVLRQMATSRTPVSSVLKTVLGRIRTPHKVQIMNGVHYSQYDRLGSFHFNIQIDQRPILHVYVTPENPISIDPSGTVNLLPYRWQFVTVTD